MKNRCVLLDKDGTLVQDVPFNVDPERIELAPGAAEGLPLLYAAGFRIIVVSNQSGVALGRFQEAALEGVQTRLEGLLAGLGVSLSGFYYCPHHPHGKVAQYSITCECRKPLPGMIVRAAREHAIDLAGSFLVGDILDDVEAGQRAGCRTVLLDNGHETVWQRSPWRWPHHTAQDLHAAALQILAASGSAVA